MCPIEYPGRGARSGEPAFSEIGPLISVLAKDLLPRLDGPFALFGHSLGALIGYEVSQLMRARYAVHPVRLFVSGCQAPHCRKHRVCVRDLSEEELLEKLRVLGGTRDDVLDDAEVMRWVLPIIRADFAVYDSYTYAGGNPLECPISAFGGTDDVTTSVEEIMAWKQHTLRDFTCRMLRCGHFLLDRDMDTVLHAIAEDLALRTG